MYKWNMEDKIYVGVIEMGYNRIGKISHKKMEIYKCWKLFN